MAETVVHLHNHTEYSLLDGWSSLVGLGDRLVELEQDSCSITDHGEVGGHLRFQKEMQSRGIRPILGMEGYFAPDPSVKEGKKGELYDHQTVLAKTTEGLHNLWALSSMAWINGSYYGNPRYGWDLLDKHKEGLYVTGGCIGGCVGKYLNKTDAQYSREKAVERLGRFLDLFGDNFFLELHTYQDDDVIQWNKEIVSLANEFSIPLLAVSDSHYLRPEDSFAHEVMIAIGTGTNVNDPKRLHFGYDQLAVYSEQTMRERLSYLPDGVVSEAIRNTRTLADSCTAEIRDVEEKPLFYNSREEDVFKLRELADKGFKRKVVDRKSQGQLGEYSERLERELKLVIDKGFPGYFLIVHDVIEHCKNQGMLIGPGRGSAGGSLLSYLLNITELDPIKNGLYFERFLDEGRDTLPDIDIDFPKEKRHHVRTYLEQKYGKHNIATIGTTSQMAIKQTLRDLCRGLDIPLTDSNKISKVLDDDWYGTKRARATTEESLVELKSPKFDPWKKKYPALFELIPGFISHIRHSGAHAAGIIISRESLIGRLPLKYKSEGEKAGDIRTQFDGKDIDELGFLKLDALGLRTLSTLEVAFELIKKNHPDDGLHWFDEWQYYPEKYERDHKTWKMLEEGHTLGVFQIETTGLTHLTRRFKPKSLEHLSDLISVFRPGIARSIDHATGLSLLEIYMQRREGKRKVVYKHPLLETVLDQTYGCFVYQEDIMKACVELAGYTLQEADAVRKILGKILANQMKQQRGKFVQGCWEHSQIDSVLANDIFDDMEAFGSYAYNRSHGNGYGTTALWTAYLKANYPGEFMAALFRTNPGQATSYTRESRRLGIPILGPDINESDLKFSFTKSGSIRYGFESIKWVGTGSQEILSHRPIESVQDFVERVPKKGLNKRAIISLIRVGAFDSLVQEDEPTQKAMDLYWESRGDWNIEDKAHQKKCDHCNGSLNAYVCANRNQWTLDNRGSNERELLGTSVTVDPLKPFLEFIKREENFPGEDAMFRGEVARIGGLITRVRRIQTKNGKNAGQDMCQLWVERPSDLEAQVEVIVGELDEDEENDSRPDLALQLVAFPGTYAKYKNDLEVGAPVLVDISKLEDGMNLENLYRLDKL